MAGFLKGIGNFLGSLFTGTAVDGNNEAFGKAFFTENPLGRFASAFGIGDMYAQEQQQIDAENRQKQNQIEAEQRANAEYDRRMADERAYNDPSAQAQRMRDAGIHPMANLGQGVTSSSTKMSAPSQSSPSMSSPRGSNTGGGISSMFQLMTAGEQLKRERLQNDLLEEQVKSERVNQIATMSQTELNQFMLSFKKQEAPLLLGGLEQRNKNFVQEYENLVKSGNATDQQIAESKQRILESQANILLVKAKQDNLISDTKYKEELTETQTWLTKISEENYHIAKIDFDIKESVYENLHRSGAYQAMTNAEKKKADAMAQMADSQLQVYNGIWNVEDKSFFGQMARFMLYLCTNMFNFGGSINQGYINK